MPLFTRREATLSILAAAAMCSSALAQPAADYPNRPVTLVVPFPPGGGTDATMRIIATYFQQITGQTMVIENKPGANTLIAANYLKHQKPDGYTLGVMTRALHMAYWQAGGKATADPLKDFTYISGTHGSIFGTVVRADSPFNTLDDLVKYAKANPGKLSFGNIGVGTTHNLTALEFARLAGIDVLHVAFKGEGESNTAVLGGHVDVGVSSGVFIPQVESGKMKLLGLALDHRLPEHQDWKTFKEQGYDVRVETMVGIGGPAGMNKDVVARLDAVFRKMTADPQFKASLMNLYQPVQYLDTDAYRKKQLDMFQKEKELVARYELNRQ